MEKVAVTILIEIHMFLCKHFASHMQFIALYRHLFYTDLNTYIRMHEMRNISAPSVAYCYTNTLEVGSKSENNSTVIKSQLTTLGSKLK